VVSSWIPRKQACLLNKPGGCLHPADRIYFHLVENNTKKDFPFRKSFQIHWQEY